MASKKRNNSRNTFIIILLSIPLLLVIIGVLVYQVTRVEDFLPTIEIPVEDELQEELTADDDVLTDGEISTTDFMKLAVRNTSLEDLEPRRQEFTWKESAEDMVKINGFQLTMLRADEELEKDIAAKVIELGLTIEENNSYEEGKLRSRAFQKDNFVCSLIAIEVDSNQAAFMQVDLLCGELAI